MRVSTLGKLVLLGALGVCTSWATSTILAHARSSKKRAALQQSAVRNNAAVGVKIPIRRLTVTKEMRAQDAANLANGLEPQVLPPGAIRAPMVSYSSLEGWQATSFGREVTVSMKARVFETLPNVVYLWSIRVYDGVRNPKVVSERYYKNQIFRTPLGQEAHPTFQESFQLPPGSYVVRVNLHQVSENFDLSKLTDEDTNRQTRVISGWKEVVIPR